MGPVGWQTTTYGVSAWVARGGGFFVVAQGGGTEGSRRGYGVSNASY